MMKVSFNVFVYLFFPAFQFFGFSQIIWSDDFESYSVGTGYVSLEGEAQVSGDYFDLFSNWTLDVFNSDFSHSNTHFIVNQVYSNKFFEARKVEEEVVWTSELIPIPGYVDVVVEVSISEVGQHEDDDYVKLYYKLDDGSETLFSNHGANFDDFTNLIASQTGLSGTTLQITIKAKNNANPEKLRFDDIIVAEKSLIITEIADPSDYEDARYIEIKNVSKNTIDLDTKTYYLSKQNNGASNDWEEFKLTGSLCPGCVRTYAKSNSGFNSSYGFDSDFENGSIDGDGNDCYVIYADGDHNTGSIVDVYGEVNIDGTNKSWDYENQRAVRNSNKTYGVSSWQSSDWNLSSATTSDMTPGSLENELRFYNSIWHPNGLVPDSSPDSKAVVVQSGMVMISSDINCTGLEVFSGSKLELSAGKGITVNGNITNNGTLKIKSDATGCGSVILTGTSTGNIQYDLYLTGGISSPWHLISAPVESQSIHSFLMDSNNSIQTSERNNYGLAIYNTSTDLWNYYHDGSGSSPNIEASTTDNFVAAKGYSVLRSSSGEVSFSGAVNVVDQNISLAAGKWNLIGNPYPSFVNVNINVHASDNIITSNTSVLSDAYEAIYLWDTSTSEYKIINQSTTATCLSPGQGFYVYADVNASEFSFTEAMQSHQSGDWFERIASDGASLKVVAEFSSTQSSTEMMFIDGATPGLDLGYDAGRFNAGNNDFYTFTSLVDGSLDSPDLALQCLPALEAFEMENIPLGVSVVEDTEVMFKLNLSNFTDEKRVYLRDLVMDEQIRLDVEGSTYTTYVNSEGPSMGRFYIYIPNEQIQLDERDDSNVRIFYDAEWGVLNVYGTITQHSLLNVFDCSGRLVFSKLLYKDSGTQIVLPRLSKGVYITELQTDNHKIVKRVVI